MQLERERTTARIYAALPPKCLAARLPEEHLLLAVLSCFHHDTVRHAKALGAMRRLPAIEPPPVCLEAMQTVEREASPFPQCVHALVSLEIANADGWQALRDAASEHRLSWLADRAEEAARDADRRWNTWTLWLCDHLAREAEEG